MNRVEVYKTAFELAQEGHYILLFAFESTESVVREYLISEYTNIPFQVLREDTALAKEKQAKFIEMINKDGKMVVISKVKLSNKEIEEHIQIVKNSHPITYVIFDKDIEFDFSFHLQNKYSVKVISSNFSINN